MRLLLMLLQLRFPVRKTLEFRLRTSGGGVDKWPSRCINYWSARARAHWNININKCVCACNQILYLHTAKKYLLKRKKKEKGNSRTCYLTCVFPEAFIETRLALKMLVWPFEVSCRGENTRNGTNQRVITALRLLPDGKVVMPGLDDHLVHIWRADVWLSGEQAKDAEVENLLLTKWSIWWRWLWQYKWWVLSKERYLAVGWLWRNADEKSNIEKIQCMDDLIRNTEQRQAAALWVGQGVRLRQRLCLLTSFDSSLRYSHSQPCNHTCQWIVVFRRVHSLLFFN